MGAGHAHALHVHGHSRVHRLAPHVKIVGVVAFVFAVAATPRRALWVYPVDAVVLALVVRAAQLPWRFVLTRATVVLPFVTFALLIPFIGSGPRTDVLGLSLSAEGLYSTGTILGRALLGVSASIVLAGTTEIPRLLAGLERLRVPPVLTAIAGFMLRYLEVLAGELRRMRTSMTARGYDPRWVWQARPLAAAAGALFVRSYERGERVHQAMLSRGYDGVMPPLQADQPAPLRDWTLALLPATAAAATAALAWTVTP